MRSPFLSWFNLGLEMIPPLMLDRKRDERQWMLLLSLFLSAADMLMLLVSLIGGDLGLLRIICLLPLYGHVVRRSCDSR